MGSDGRRQCSSSVRSIATRLPMSSRSSTSSSLNPLVVSDDGEAAFVHGRVETPIGIWPMGDVEPIVRQLAWGSTVILFSDGLVERAGEVLDEGLDRLRACALQEAKDLGSLVDKVLSGCLAADGKDDAAVVGLRWAR